MTIEDVEKNASQGPGEIPQKPDTNIESERGLERLEEILREAGDVLSDAEDILSDPDVPIKKRNSIRTGFAKGRIYCWCN